MTKKRYNQRVKVTLNPETSLVVRRLSDLTGESMSSLMATLVEPHVSQLAEIADLLVNAKEKRQELARKGALSFKASLSYFEDLVQDKIERNALKNKAKMESYAEHKASAVSIDCNQGGAVSSACSNDVLEDFDDWGSDSLQDYDDIPIDADGSPL